MQKLAKKWIQKAIKHEGALHKQLGVPEDKKIPASKLNAAAEKGGKLGRRARLAKTLKKLGGKEPTMNKVAREMGRLVAHERLVKEAKDKALETFVKLAVSFAEDAGLTKRQIEDMLAEKMAEFEEIAETMEKSAASWYRPWTWGEGQTGHDMRELAESVAYGQKYGLPQHIAVQMAMAKQPKNVQQMLGWAPPGAQRGGARGGAQGGWGGPATGGGQPIDYSGGGSKSLYGRDMSKLFARAGYDPRGHQQMMDSLQALQFGGLNRQTRGQELAALARQGTGMGLI
jgi:hypothetical protein